MAVRSAEASRTASCSFADRIANLSIAFYKKQCPASLLASFQQTVLATIVMQAIDESGISSADCEGAKSNMQIISMGVGTKVVSAERIMAHKTGHHVDSIVRDSHAEVLARRGFMKYLYNQVTLYHKDNKDVDGSDAKFCIFERKGSGCRLTVKSGIRFHLYTSSQPCGNASIKRWAKVKPVRFRNDLSEDCFPLDPHTRLQITPESRSEGQVALLVKRNNPTSNEPARLSDTMTPDTKTDASAVHIPAGTALPSTGEGNVMCCSDKIAMWNAVGIQGALLNTYIEPVYLSTITVGRKFSQVHCQRALCCRLQDFSYPEKCIAAAKRSNKKRKNNTHLQGSTDANSEYSIIVEGSGYSTDIAEAPVRSETTTGPLFSIHHPTMLGTQVKLDEGSIFTSAVSLVAAENSECNECTSASSAPSVPSVTALPTVGARFDEPRCLVSYATHSALHCGTDMMNYTLEVLDGRTGLLVLPATASELISASAAQPPGSHVSSVSSASLLTSFVELQDIMHNASDKHSCINPAAGDVNSNTAYVSLKRRVAREYCAAKDSLRSDPLMFAEWVRKGCI